MATPKKTKRSAPAKGSSTPTKKPKTENYDMSNLLDSTLFSDFEIRCRGETIKVHRSILYAKGGKYFANIVAGEMKESKQGFVDLSEDGLDEVKALVNYFYDKEQDGDVNVDELINTYVLADKYDIFGLRSHCLNRLAAFTNEMALKDVNGLLQKLISPHADRPPHCTAELLSSVSSLIVSSDTVRGLLAEDTIRANLGLYGPLAAECAKILETMLDAEERKMGNIQPVCCQDVNCPGRNRRWTYKHGPRGGNPVHCLYCGSAASVVAFGG